MADGHGTDGEQQYTNRLAGQTSPYLLQHAHNPVEWYPWGAEALERARKEDLPIFLSIGYSACHWCHVMERESFEDADIAEIMNRQFVSIKVDREERPDLDSIYMEAVQALTGRGGWPLSVFLTPDGVPFFGGTYYPPQEGRGMPSFRRVLESVNDAWTTRREEIVQSAEQIRGQLGRRLAGQPTERQLDTGFLDRCAEGMAEGYDAVNGGFGQAPKFPQPMNLEFLLRTWKRKDEAKPLAMVERTLERMARGGIYDQLGGGFHRYSTDAKWLAPHFEKMLYDNAQLARLYLNAWQATQKPLYRRIAEETLDYVQSRMTSPEGGFYSAEDADSEGEEGKYYVWSLDNVQSLLDPADARIVALYYDVTAGGNFEGANILHCPRDLDVVAAMARISEEDVVAAVARARPVLLAAREQRVPPGLDTKVLVSWNGMMLRAFAEAAAVLDRADYRQTAVRNAEFVLDHMLVKARLLHSYNNGQAHLNGYLEDYVNYADGLLALYETTFDLRWFEAARALVGEMVEHFIDDDGAGFFDTSDDHEELVRRPKDVTDNAVPSGNSVAADVLLRLAAFTQQPNFEESANRWLNAMADVVQQYPTNFGRLLCAADFALGTPKEVAIIGPLAHPATDTLLQEVYGRYLPNRVLAVADPDDPRSSARIALLAERPMIDGAPTAYVCEHFVCLAPSGDPATLAEQLTRAPEEVWTTV
ncbi:MAG: thioredoxin domain-containing protein [Chloroflexota bacterium]